MELLSNPHRNHLIHISILGISLFFEFVTLAISAAFIARGKSQYYGYYFDASGLIVAASVLSIIASAVYIVFNTVGTLYHGIKNILSIELAVFGTLFILNIAGAAALSDDGWQFGCSSKACQLGKATLAFAWLSTLTLLLLLAFLLTWASIHRKRRAETSIFKSNIKAYDVDGEAGRESQTGMSHIPASASITGGVRSTSPAAVSDVAHV